MQNTWQLLAYKLSTTDDVDTKLAAHRAAMRFVLLLHLCLLELGLCVASPGLTFLMTFPPHNDPAANVSHQVTIVATGVWTSVTVKVLETSFVRRIVLSASRSKTIHLPPSVGSASARSSYLLSVTSVKPVSVLASFCTQTGCDHSLLHDVSSWGTHYYPVTPHFSDQTAVSQMVITSADHETLVDVLLSGEVLFNGTVYPSGSVFKLHIGPLQSVYLESNTSLSGSELSSQEAVGVVVGFTCFKHPPGDCVYGFAELKPVSRWSVDYILLPFVNTAMSSSVIMATTLINSTLNITTSTGQNNLSLVGGVTKVIPVVTSDKIHITSDNPLQLINLRHDGGRRFLTLTVLPSAEDICQSVPMFESGDMNRQEDNRAHTVDLKSGVKFSQKAHLTRLSDSAELRPAQTHTDVGRYLTAMNKLHSLMCEKPPASCEEMHCGHKQKCFYKEGKPLCSLETKICSAWGDSYYRMFDGRDFVLRGNCNYTLVQTDCTGSNSSVPLQINVARAYLNSATVSTIHTVMISIQGFNISIVKGAKNHLWINGQKRNLPLTLGNGSVNFYPSGSSVVLDTNFGLTLQYDWKHHLQVEVGPELYGGVCGFCGNANHSSSGGVIASNDSESKSVDFHLPWVVSGDVGSCIEDCGGLCPMCTQSQTKSFPAATDDSLENSCTLLRRSDGPFADCHSFIDPEPFVTSCVDTLCVTRVASSMCKVLTAYVNTCQRLGARVQRWRTITKCTMACPMNSRYESCGSACPATCGNPEAHQNCTQPCVESCQCNAGYFLSGGECVPQSKCGCLHQGSYYLPNETSWVDEHCREKCVCQPNSKKIICAQSSCGNGEVCKVLNGVLGCHMDGPGMCLAKGDHYTTFDGRNLDVYGNCSYLLTSTCPTWGDFEDFNVEVHNQIKDAANVSFRRVEMLVSGYSIEVSNDWSDRVKVNGLLLRLPSVLSRGKVKLFKTGLSTYMETDFGLVVTYSPDILTVKMPKIFSGNLCGLCGNFNADPEDDLRIDDESDISEAIEYWKTSKECVDVSIESSACSSHDMALYRGKDFCGRLLDTEGSFRGCHKTVDPQDFYDDCVDDLCYGNQTTLCQVLSGYVAVCQDMGATVDGWRASTFCNLSCPPYSEYQLCSSHISDCVENRTRREAMCKEGCFCRPGFFSSGDRCVPDSECGCMHEGVYHEMNESFYPDERCQLHCICVGHNTVQCTNNTCPNGTNCAVRDGHRACRAPQPFECSVMGGRHFRNYDGHSFDLNLGNCRYVLSQTCDEEESDPDVVVMIQQGRLYLRIHGVNMSLEMEHLGKVKIDGALWALPVQLDHVVILRSGLLTRVVLDTGVSVNYGGPNLIKLVIPAARKKMCGLCGNLSAVALRDKQSLNGSLANDVSRLASSWSLSPPGANCSEECALCSVCNSSMAAAFASDNICGTLLSPTGAFSGCHSTVDPEPFFQNCVTDLCLSNGNEELFCSSLSQYTFECQGAGAEVKPWRSEKCSLPCPENSHYSVCVGACPKSCGISSDIHCPWPCYEGCQCKPGYMQSGNDCVKAEQCGCFYRGHYYEIGEILWTEGCSEQCNCTATSTMCCAPAFCPEGESCALNNTNTWGCARKADDDDDDVKNQSQPQQAQCWVIEGTHFYTFDGRAFEFQGNCTYTLVHLLNDTSENDTVWIWVQKDTTLNESSSLKAIHAKVDEDNISIYREDKGYVWINGEKRPLPVTLQSGLVKLSQSGVLVVMDTNRGIQVKYDWSHIATILLSSAAEVGGMCGNNNGIKEDDLRSPRGEALDATTFGWSWRVPDVEVQCVADCGAACPHCSADQLHAEYVARRWISLHENIWSPENPFYSCWETVNYTEISTGVSIYDLCSSNDTQKTLCLILEAYAAACQLDQVQIGEWRNNSFCPMTCPLNSHYESCSSSCPTTCENQFISSPCSQICVQTCECDSGFVLDGDTCVPSSRCNCTRYGHSYRSYQTSRADEGCTERCVCNPHTHQMLCHWYSCGPDEYCALEEGVRRCVPQRTCMYTGNHVSTFDHYYYDLHGTCQYQLLSICGQQPGLEEIQVHTQTDGHADSELGVLINVSGVLVKLNSKDTENVEVDGVKRIMPYVLSSSALVFSLGLHTYIYTEMGFAFSLSIEGIVSIRLSHKYANATCGLCGNFNSDPVDDLTANDTQERLSPENFGKAWRRGQDPRCVEGCLGGSCPNCSSERLALFADPEACGKILQVNGPFRHCQAKVDPSSFYKRCVADLCLHGGLQPALCRSLAAYSAACHSHGATVYAWRTPGFCYPSCPSSTIYNTSSATVHACIGWQNNTVELPINAGENCYCEEGLVHSGSHCVHPENCGCFHRGEYLKAGQEASTCKQSCSCHAGGNVTCHNVSCGENEECKLVRGVQGCHPKLKVVHCSVEGSQYTTFDGRTFEFQGSCNYTLVQMCSLMNRDVAPVVISAQGNGIEGRQIHLQVNHMHFHASAAFAGKIQVNGVYENLPFSQNNVTVHQKNGWIIIKTPQSFELTSNLRDHIWVKIPDIYRRTTCGLCGNYNDNPSDDLQLPNGTVISDPDIFGPSWRSSDIDSSCSDACNGSCQLCQTPVLEYSSDLHCGLLIHPGGPFSPCHSLVRPQNYYSLCMKNLCIAKGQRWVLCDALWTYDVACKEAGGVADLWRQTTGCAYQCHQFSNYSQCANVCSSLCPETIPPVRCSRDCEEGCMCDSGHLFDGHACVPAGQCGCVQDGRRFDASESKLLQNCTVSCSCGPPLVCENHSCPPLHSCAVLDGIMGCHKDEQIPDPCEGKCDEAEKCSLSDSVPVCVSHQGLCWTWAGQHYHTFDGLSYDFKGTCTYLLAGSKGSACDLTPFSVSIKYDNCTASPSQVVAVQAHGFHIKLSSSEEGRLHVNGLVTYIPVALLGGKIKVSYKDSKTLLKTDFGMHIVFGWNSTVVTLDPRYKGKVYGLCGNFNGDPKDEYPAATPGSPPINTSVELAQVYQLSDADHDCCTGCEQELEATPLPAHNASNLSSSHTLCAVLTDQNGPWAHCHSRVNPDSFYESCVDDHMNNGLTEAALDQAIQSYSIVCEESRVLFSDKVIAVRCPLNSHYKTCGSACPPSCEVIAPVCNKACAQGCFCDPGFIRSPQGCVRPRQCGCTDSRGKYHSLGSTFWIPDDCGQLCICGPAPGESHCRPDRCPGGMVCERLHHKRACQPKKTQSCTLVTGLHFKTFDGHYFDFRGRCAYSLVQTNSNPTGLTPFNITISDASCRKRLFHSLTLTLSIYGLDVVVRKDDPGKVLVDGRHKHLPYFHPTGHLNAYHTPSSLIIHTDVGLQLVVHNSGTLMVNLPSSYGSSVSGLCGNANDDPDDDRMISSEELAHSWRSETCRSNCSSGPKPCPVETRKTFEGSGFCGVLLNTLGPFADCASVLSPKSYFDSCVADCCSFDGHYSALCNSIASYAAACQAAQLPVRQWRSDTFCGMSCPKNSHYELCGPRCPVVCAERSSPANCSGGCEEGCQCDTGYLLSDGQCVLVSNCGCMHEGQYHPAGNFYSEESCLTCNCKREVTCRPVEGCSAEDGLVLQPGVCQVFAGFGYITFDGVFLPHHGACTYVASALSSKALNDYSLLLSFTKNSRGIFTISRLVFNLLSLEVSVDPETLWKIQVNGEERSLPFDNGELAAHRVGSRLTIVTPSGVGIELSSTQYLRLTVPQVYDAAPSGLCGNSNGEKYDDMALRSGRLTESFADLLHSWAVEAHHCSDICGRECDECALSSPESVPCDLLLNSSVEFSHCGHSVAERSVYREMCIRAVCAGAEHTARCLALEAFSANCQAKGIPVVPWRESNRCSLKCPDSSSPRECVDSSSSSCPALLQPGSSAADCEAGCQCSDGNVFQGDKCVPYRQCGCVLQDLYIKMDEKLYTRDCTQICWCHITGGVICEAAGCSPGQQCALRNGFWGCHDRPEVCKLWDSLQISTLTGQQLSLEAGMSYSVMSLCDEASAQWFSLISYHGPCGRALRFVTVFQILLRGSTVDVQEGTVKVNGQLVSLPHTLSSGVSLSSGVNQDKSEVIILRRDPGMESELEMEIGVTMMTIKVPLSYSGKLCGLCGNLNDLHSHSSVQSWALGYFPACGFPG